MSINKFQVSSIALINALSAIYSWISISKYGWIYKSLDDTYHMFYVALICMAISSTIIALYFLLMCLHKSICGCLTGDDDIKGPAFSFCGCIFNIILVSAFVFGWFTFIIHCISCESFWSSTYPLLWNSYIILLSNPCIVISLMVIFWIVKKCKKKDNYINAREYDGRTV
jgi:hypothetical protein